MEFFYGLKNVLILYLLILLLCLLWGQAKADYRGDDIAAYLSDLQASGLTTIPEQFMRRPDKDIATIMNGQKVRYVCWWWDTDGNNIADAWYGIKIRENHLVPWEAEKDNGRCLPANSGCH